MKRYRALAVCGGLWLGSLSCGCTNFAESRVIEAFQESLNNKKMNELRDSTSADFESRALSHGTPWDSLSKMEFPDGKTKILKVEDSKDDQKREIKTVTAEVGPYKKKVVYRLKKETPSQKWVVDNVFLNHRALEEDKSVVAHLHLQVSAHEVVETWRQEDRSKILETATADFKQTLSELPPERVAMLSSLLLTGITQDTTAKDLEIIEDKATAKFSRQGADLVLKLRQVNGQWLLDDMRVDSREGESISSARHLAAATTSAVAFYSAYRSSDKTALERLCTPDFFNGTIKVPDLSQLPLPLPTTGSKDFDTRLEGPAAEVTVVCDDKTVKLSLQGSTAEDPQAAPRYQVREVTVYDLKTRQDMRLSTVFTGRAIMQIYSEALQQRNLEVLRSMSTPDFNRRVWNKTTANSLMLLPMDEVENAAPQIENAVYRGAVTHISVLQGKTPLSFVLRDVAGKTLVDDVEIPTADKDVTLKMRLELMLPVVEFIEGLRQPSLEMLRANSTKIFSRTVWNHLKTIPQLRVAPLDFLDEPLTHIAQKSSGEAWVVLGTEQYGAKIFLQRERDQYVVDDITLVAGPSPKQRVQLAALLRTRMARGEDHPIAAEPQRAPSSTPANVIRQASHETTAEPSDTETR